MSIWSRLTRKTPEPETRDITSLEDFINSFKYGGLWYGTGYSQTSTLDPVSIGGNFAALSVSAFGGNAVVAACMGLRMRVFASTRFRFQRLRDGKAGDYFGTPALRRLERPWVGGTTQNLLTQMIVDADLAGNSFWIRDGAELVRLRPDWVEIAVEWRRNREGAVIGQRKLGYVYYEGGKHSGNDGAAFLADEVAHFMPTPDPLYPFRGMSPLTPVIRELEADIQMTRHKSKFFTNGATPNMVIKHPQGATLEKILQFDKALDDRVAGTDNAYKRLNLYPGADVTIAGATLSQIDFKAVQGAGETRIAAALGVSPVLASLSEGLQGSSLNAGNFGAARRLFADGTADHLWREAAGSLEVLVPAPGPDSILAHDPDVPFTREDRADAADIEQVKATTIAGLITAGYVPDSVVAAVEAGDYRLLVHSGLYSVQLWKPGADENAPVVDEPPERALPGIPAYGRKPA